MRAALVAIWRTSDGLAVCDQNLHAALAHALEQRGELGRRRRNTRMWLGGCHDLQTEVLGEIRPTVVHDHDLRAAKRREDFLPVFDLLGQRIDKAVLFVSKNFASCGLSFASASRIAAVIGTAFAGSSQ